MHRPPRNPVTPRAAPKSSAASAPLATSPTASASAGAPAPADARGYRFPPLWGPDSFNDGAGMDHFTRAVGFIHRNMPRGTEPGKPQLTLQEAWDAAALLQSKPRPHYEPGG